jgi:DNA-binding GntR family transcriptional regulator
MMQRTPPAFSVTHIVGGANGTRETGSHEQGPRGDRIGRDGAGMKPLPSIDNLRTAQDLVKETVRRAILRGDLPGGARLVQADLANQLGVSTTPIREALRDLAGAGLITLDRNRGGVVRELNLQELEEIREITEQLRRLAVTLAVHGITDEHLREAEELADQMDAETDLASWVDLNLRFHFIFFEATGRDRLTAILKSLEEATTLYVAQVQQWHPEFRSGANAIHRSLIAAYRARDIDAAVAAMAAGSVRSVEMTDGEDPRPTAGEGAGVRKQEEVPISAGGR